MTTKGFILGNAYHPQSFMLQRELNADKQRIYRFAWSPDGSLLAAATRDGTIRIWHDSDNNPLHCLKRHPSGTISVAWSKDGGYLASASRDGTIFIWDTKTWKKISGRKEKGDWSPITWGIGDSLAFGTFDGKIKLWTKTLKTLIKSFTAHDGSIFCLSWNPSYEYLASSAADGKVKLWDRHTLDCVATIGSPGGVTWAIAWSPDGNSLATGGTDGTIRLWSVKNQKEEIRLEGLGEITSLSFLNSGNLMASKSEDNSVRIWRYENKKNWDLSGIIHDNVISNVATVSFHPSKPLLASVGAQDTQINIWNFDYNKVLGGQNLLAMVKYRNAKIVVVGKAGVGKTGLSMVLAGKGFIPTESTAGRNVLYLGREHEERSQEIHEIFIWDMGGQEEYRLVNQLSLHQISLALILFDASNIKSSFSEVRYWYRAIQQATNNATKIFLVAARTDVSTPTMIWEEVSRCFPDIKFVEFFKTSAKTGEGINDLRNKILNSIPWDQMPLIVSELLFKEMKIYIYGFKKEKHIISISDLLIQFQKVISNPPNLDAIRSVLLRLEITGVIKLLGSDQVLLTPETLENYASRIAQVAREHKDGQGRINEENVLNGTFEFASLKRILPQEDERTILSSAIELFIKQNLVVRRNGDLIFPSQVNRVKEHWPEDQILIISYTFIGSILHAYTSLVVKLHKNELFTPIELYKYAALFSPFHRRGNKYNCGLLAEETQDGKISIKILFGQDVEQDTKIFFLKYVDDYLRESFGHSLSRTRHYVCRSCNKTVKDHSAIDYHKSLRHQEAICAYCGQPIALNDAIDEFIGAYEAHVDQTTVSNNIAKEHIVIGRVFTIVGEAKQVFRLQTMWDWGIDGEIEFFNDQEEASGKKIYLQLKSGSSHLKFRKSDRNKTINISERHRKYWREHDCPVYLIIMDGIEINWANISETLPPKSNKHNSHTVAFNSEPFTKEALLRVREKILALSERGLAK